MDSLSFKPGSSSSSSSSSAPLIRLLQQDPAPPEQSPDLFAGAAGGFPDLLCKLHLDETTSSKSGKEASAQRRIAAAMAAGAHHPQRRHEGPPTPGRPIFGFSSAILPSTKKLSGVPSKWDNAEKWLVGGSGGIDSPARPPSRVVFNKQSAAGAPIFHKGDEFEVLLKDKFTDNYTEPSAAISVFRHSDPATAKEGFMFNSTPLPPAKDSGCLDRRRRDVGTEMTPQGSSTTSRCHTPVKKKNSSSSSSSPARHNTPANRSGPLVPYAGTTIDISELEGCHFAKLELSAQYGGGVMSPPTNWWGSREEEEEEVSKCLRHCEVTGGGGARRLSGAAAAAAWEDEERTKSCVRFQREEAKIQAWVNLQGAKAEAQARKLEVKIERMRSRLEEKVMKRMALAHRKAQEWRAEALLHHSHHLIKLGFAPPLPTTTMLAKTFVVSGASAPGSCGCLPYSSNNNN